MKPVMEKVAANLFEDRIKPLFGPVKDFYDDEVKPYTGTLDAKGYAGSSALGGLLGYLYSKYISDDDSPWSNIISTLGGALAGAGIHTATQIMRERGRIKSNETLPPDQQVNPDGTPKSKKPPLLDTISGLTTAGAGYGGYRLGTAAFNRFAPSSRALRQAQENLTEAVERIKNLGHAVDTADRAAYMAAETARNTARDAISPRRRRLAGGLGALLLGGSTYALTNPRTRAAIAKKLDE